LTETLAIAIKVSHELLGIDASQVVTNFRLGVLMEVFGGRTELELVPFAHSQLDDRLRRHLSIHNSSNMERY
jgi:hypothetical protein